MSWLPSAHRWPAARKTLSAIDDRLRLERALSRNDDVIVSGVSQDGFTPEPSNQFGREKRVLGLVFVGFAALLL